MPWSPSRIGMVERHCPKTLDHRQNGVPTLRRHFDVGVAAHHVLQAAGEQQEREHRLLRDEEFTDVAADVLRRLVSDGRVFEGNKEPPLNATRAAEGLELALDYLEFFGLPLGAKYELALAVNEEWEPVPWSERWFGCIVDVIYEMEDFATEAVSVVVTDYKTSWAANASELDTLQRKAQALCALAHYPDVDEVTLKLVNLRTLNEYVKTVPAESPVIARWRGEITTIIGALEGPRTASPGAGCYDCPYLSACPEGMDYFERSETIWQYGSDEEKAKAYALAITMVGKLRDALKPVVGDGTIKADDTEVGYVLQESRKAKSGAWHILWDAWQKQGGDLDGFFALHEPTIAQIGYTAKKLWPERGDADTRERFIAKATQPNNRAVFKALKTK
jgi:CRISPR/Cas system-associated exonuclease Cas4 (RecB family)